MFFTTKDEPIKRLLNGAWMRARSAVDLKQLRRKTRVGCITADKLRVSVPQGNQYFSSGKVCFFLILLSRAIPAE